MFYNEAIPDASTSQNDLDLNMNPNRMSESQSPMRGSSLSNDPNRQDVNEIIVKIEMRKFQNLIENRIKHKNNLLQADMKRIYPLNKIQEQICKAAKGDQELIDQLNSTAGENPGKPKPAKRANKFREIKTTDGSPKQRQKSQSSSLDRAAKSPTVKTSHLNTNQEVKIVMNNTVDDPTTGRNSITNALEGFDFKSTRLGSKMGTKD